MNTLLRKHRGTMYGFNHQFDEFITYRPGMLMIRSYPSSEIRCKLPTVEMNLGQHRFSQNDRYLAVGFYSTESNWKLEKNSKLFDIHNCREATDFVGQVSGQQIYLHEIGQFSPDSERYTARGVIHKGDRILEIKDATFQLTTR